MQALKNIYEMVAQNLKIACTKITDNVNPIPTKLKEGDLATQLKLSNLIM